MQVSKTVYHFKNPGSMVSYSSIKNWSSSFHWNISKLALLRFKLPISLILVNVKTAWHITIPSPVRCQVKLACAFIFRSILWTLNSVYNHGYTLEKKVLFTLSQNNTQLLYSVADGSDRKVRFNVFCNHVPVFQPKEYCQLVLDRGQLNSFSYVVHCQCKTLVCFQAFYQHGTY